MKNIKYLFESENLIGCFLKLNEKIYWAVYFPDDGSKKLIFSSNKSSIQHIENFNGTTIEKIKEIMNKNGFEVEPDQDFEDILYFNNIPSNVEVYLKGYKKSINYEIKIS